MRIRNHGNGNYESRDFNIRMETSDTYLPPIDRETGTLDYSKIKVGAKTLEDAVIDSPLKKVNRTYTDKENILRWLHNGDVKTLKQVSKFFYRTSGIYQRLCRYLAYMYRYDWYVVPYVDGGDTYPDDGDKGDISAQRVNKIIDNLN